MDSVQRLAYSAQKGLSYTLNAKHEETPCGLSS